MLKLDTIQKKKKKKKEKKEEEEEEEEKERKKERKKERAGNSFSMRLLLNVQFPRFQYNLLIFVVVVFVVVCFVFFFCLFVSFSPLGAKRQSLIHTIHSL